MVISCIPIPISIKGWGYTMTIVSRGRKPFEELLPESRVRENLQHGLMRGRWKRRHHRSPISATALLYLRTIHMSAKKYIEHVGTLRGWDSKTVPVKLLSALGEMLKGNLWVVEISLPELFPANRRNLGEIILNPLSTGKDLSCFLFARILDKIYFFAPDSSSKLSLISYDAGIDTHTELYPENRSIV